MTRTTLATMALILLAAGDAAGRPPPPPEEEPAPRRPLIEWSPWIRVAHAVAGPDAAAAARVVTPAPELRDASWEAAIGVDATIPISSDGDVRIGPFAEARTSSGPVVGGELQIGASPARLDLFWYQGEGQLTLRAGAGRDVTTGAVAYGYRAPWSLSGPWTGATRYMIGVRFVASATRSRHDPDDWSATLGLEVEPVGALRYLLGVRSWY